MSYLHVVENGRGLVHLEVPTTQTLHLYSLPANQEEAPVSHNGQLSSALFKGQLTRRNKCHKFTSGHDRICVLMVSMYTEDISHVLLILTFTQMGMRESI